jgi:hypothetical protein
MQVKAKYAQRAMSGLPGAWQALPGRSLPGK